MKRVGDAIPNTLRCTGLGGLAITKAAKEIEARLALQNGQVARETEGKGFFKVC
jgi:L-serine dehydratase